MSGPPVAVKRSLGTCVNPTCSAINSRTFGQSSKAPLKCGRCRTARYCGKDCQRAHWPQHKQYCAAWQQFSEAEGVPLAQIKVKMAHFIWLLRGFPEYVMRLFDEHDYHRRKHDPRGFIDFQFDSPEELFKAIDVLQSQPIIEPDFPFAAMPGSPSFNGNPESTTKLPLRQVREEDEQAFANAVDARMAFTSAGDSRKNLQQVLDIAKKHRLMLVVSITVILPDSFATHMYDYMYRQISWVPELSPEEVYGPRKRKT